MRPKFKIAEGEIKKLLINIREKGLMVNPQKSEISLADMKDLPFYEAFLETYKAGAYLITGNLKHFPSNPFTISLRDALDFLDLF